MPHKSRHDGCRSGCSGDASAARRYAARMSSVLAPAGTPRMVYGSADSAWAGGRGWRGGDREGADAVRAGLRATVGVSVARVPALVGVGVRRVTHQTAAQSPTSSSVAAAVGRPPPPQAAPRRTPSAWRLRRGYWRGFCWAGRIVCPKNTFGTSLPTAMSAALLRRTAVAVATVSDLPAPGVVPRPRHARRARCVRRAISCVRGIVGDAGAPGRRRRQRVARVSGNCSVGRGCAWS